MIYEETLAAIALRRAIEESVWAPRGKDGRELPLSNPAWAECLRILNGDGLYCSICHRPSRRGFSSPDATGTFCERCGRGRMIPGEAMIRKYGMNHLAERYYTNT
jgi:hypothetical protein